MRLPERNEIEKARILEREEDMKAGLALAKKIDQVRLEYIREKNNLEKFRTETTKLVQKEIDDLIIIRDSLKKEIQSLT